MESQQRERKDKPHFWLQTYSNGRRFWRVSLAPKRWQRMTLEQRWNWQFAHVVKQTMNEKL